jgi:hypothetical protein
MRQIGLLLLILSAVLFWVACGADESSNLEVTPDPVDNQEVVDAGGTLQEPELETCTYPDNNGVIDVGKIMPSFVWEDALLGDGSLQTLDLHEFYCSDEWADYSVIVFSVSAGWCPACPSQVEYLTGLAPELEAAGALLVWVETQTADGLPASHLDSSEFVDGIIGEGGPGLRVGDGLTVPMAMGIQAAPLITSYPGGFVVRRSDMTIITSQANSATYPDYVAIATDPESTIEIPDQTGPPNCGPDEEELYEPNNISAEATVFGAEESYVSFFGGVCDAFPDFYRIEYDGHWFLQIFFTNAQGDLDMFVWDDVNNQIQLDSGGTPVGSATVSDHEEYHGIGPTTIAIFGYAGATAQYEFILGEI